MRHGFLLAVLVMSGWGVLTAQMPEADALRLADGLYSRKLYDLALPEYVRLLARDPAPEGVGRIAFRAGECARALDRMEEAVGYYQQTLRTAPESTIALRARYRLGELAFDNQQWEIATRQLQALIGADPGPPLEAPARFLLAQTREAAGDPATARTQYRALVASNPEDPLAGVAALRLAALGDGTVDDRQQAYELALENAVSDDMRVEALWGLAGLETARRNHPAAAERYWELWTRFPDHQRVREGMIYLAWSQLQAGDFAQALTLHGATSDSRRAAYPDTWAYLEAVSLDRLDRAEAAVAAYAAFLEAFPDSRFRAEVGYDLAVRYGQSGEHEKVLALATEIGEVSGREAEGIWLLAESARAAGQTDAAITYTSRLIQDHPQAPMRADALYIRSVLRLEADPARALEDFVSFAETYPTDGRAMEAWLQAGRLALAAGDLEKGYGYWSRALEEAEDPPVDALRRIALLAVRLERDAEAVIWSRKALELEMPASERGETRFWLGVVQERMGDGEAAAQSLAEAVTEAPEADWTGRARMRLGRLYQQAGREEEALEAFLPLAAGPQSSGLPDALLLWLLEIAEETEQDPARITLAQALQQDDRPDAIRELGAYAEGRAWSDDGKPNKAIQAWTRGLAFDSESLDAAEAGLALGAVLVSRQRGGEALEAYGRAAEVASALEAGRLQAEALSGMGDAEMSRENWEAAGRHYLSVSVLFDDPVVVPRCLQSAVQAFERAGQPARAEAARSELAARYPDAAASAITPNPVETP